MSIILIALLLAMITSDIAGAGTREYVVTDLSDILGNSYPSEGVTELNNNGHIAGVGWRENGLRNVFFLDGDTGDIAILDEEENESLPNQLWDDNILSIGRDDDFGHWRYYYWDADTGKNKEVPYVIYNTKRNESGLWTKQRKVWTADGGIQEIPYPSDRECRSAPHFAYHVSKINNDNLVIMTCYDAKDEYQYDYIYDVSIKQLTPLCPDCEDRATVVALNDHSEAIVALRNDTTKSRHVQLMNLRTGETLRTYPTQNPKHLNNKGEAMCRSSVPPLFYGICGKEPDSFDEISVALPPGYKGENLSFFNDKGQFVFSFISGAPPTVESADYLFEPVK